MSFYPWFYFSLIFYVHITCKWQWDRNEIRCVVIAVAVSEFLTQRLVQAKDVERQTILWPIFLKKKKPIWTGIAGCANVTKQKTLIAESSS